jgi:MoxR-like ATPase
MNDKMTFIRKSVAAVICALLALQPGSAAASALKVRTTPVKAVPTVGAVGSNLGAASLSSVSTLSTLRLGTSLPSAENLRISAPQAHMEAATAASPWASRPIQSAVLSANGQKVEIRESAALKSAATATTPEKRKPLAKTMASMRDAVANLPKLPAATMGAAHSAGMALHNALTGERSHNSGNAVAAPSAVFAANRSGLKASDQTDADETASFLEGLSNESADPYQGPANAELQAKVEQTGQKINALRDEVGKVIVGQHDMVDSLIVAMIGGEHVLLEGLPGIAKTLTVNTIADATGADWSRIQMTPDLLPKSITGGKILQVAPDGTRSMEVQHGPVHGKQMVLADEINRATPRTQSALLEIMQEKQISMDGVTYDLTDGGKKPFFMLATQNPVEQEGTNPLPEAQQDRFMYKVTLDQPGRSDRMLVNDMQRKQVKPKAEKVVSLEEMAEARTIAEEIYMAQDLREYVQNILDATLDPSAIGIGEEGLVQVAMITRASIIMEKAARINAMMNGRSWVTEQDVRDITPKILRHRIKLDFKARDMTNDMLIERILERTPVTESQFNAMRTQLVQAQAAEAAAEDATPQRPRYWWVKWAALVVGLGVLAIYAPTIVSAIMGLFA